MKIVIAPDSFKGSLSTMAAADAVEAGVLRVFPEAEIKKVPVADGGEGMIEAVHAAAGGTVYTITAKGPLGDPVEAQYLMTDDRTAVIEMAQASGLPLIADRRDPLCASTYGTGELVAAALHRGAQKLVIGIGGSATNDGGTGLARALGARFLDAEGRELPDGGGSLDRLAKIDISGLDPLLRGAEIIAACDVKNPLCGGLGASAVYGPQKGATPEDVRRLDGNLAHYAEILKRDLGADVSETPGAGAAGGLGAGLMAFCGACLAPGIETVLDIAKIDDALAGASLVITGEGRADFQSAFGKVPDGIRRRAAKYGVPTALVAGSLGKGAETLYESGIAYLAAIPDGPMELSDCVANAAKLLADASERLMRAIRIGMELGTENAG